MVKIMCENEFCVYQNYNNTCILDDIHLDIQGNCQDCIYVNIDYNLLKEAKDKANK